MDKTVKKIISRILGLVKNQNFWEKVHSVALSKMNFGNGGDFIQSGELGVLIMLHQKLRHENEIIVFDVGAYEGNYALSVSSNLGSNTKIHCFEPSKTTYAVLLENTKDQKNIITNNFGLSDKDQRIRLYSNSDSPGLTSLYERKIEHHGVTMDKTEEVNLTTIDHYCVQNKINRIHFLKLDIEGHELSALFGAHTMITEKRIDFIQFEFGGTNIDSRTFFKDFFNLLNNHYQIFRITRDGMQEIPCYTETHEVFMSINYFASRK